jgi:transcriptional regulator with XRE-family HTH domain
MNYSKVLKNFRVMHNLTLEQMSANTGININTLGRMENGYGQPQVRTIHRIYKAYPEFARICADIDMIATKQETNPQERKADTPSPV